MQATLLTTFDPPAIPGGTEAVIRFELTRSRIASLRVGGVPAVQLSGASNLFLASGDITSQRSEVEIQVEYQGTLPRVNKQLLPFDRGNPRATHETNAQRIAASIRARVEAASGDSKLKMARTVMLRFDVLTSTTVLGYLSDGIMPTARLEVIFGHRPSANFSIDAIDKLTGDMGIALYQRASAYARSIAFVELPMCGDPRIESVASYLRELFSDGLTGDRLQQSVINNSLMRFANGELRYDPHNYAVEFNGEPDSAIFFALAEFSFHASSPECVHQATNFWLQMMGVAVALEEVYVLRYGPRNRAAHTPSQYDIAFSHSSFTVPLSEQALVGLMAYYGDAYPTRDLLKEKHSENIMVAFKDDFLGPHMSGVGCIDS